MRTSGPPRHEIGGRVARLLIALNGNDSHQVAEALSARGVPFIYSTGNTGHGLRDGYSDRPVLKKPFKYEDLAAILTRLLKRPQHGPS